MGTIIFWAILDLLGFSVAIYQWFSNWGPRVNFMGLHASSKKIDTILKKKSLCKIKFSGNFAFNQLKHNLS